MRTLSLLPILLSCMALVGCQKPDRELLNEPVGMMVCPTSWCKSANAIAMQDGKIVAYYQRGWKKPNGEPLEKP